MRRIESASKPRLHEYRSQLWALVAAVAVEKSVKWPHEFHEIVSESFLVCFKNLVSRITCAGDTPVTQDRKKVKKGQSPL